MASLFEAAVSISAGSASSVARNAPGYEVQSES